MRTYLFIHFYSVEPQPPGKIDRKMSNFSSNQLYLRWEPSGQNTFLNHYTVVINGHQQQTFGSVPEIYWTKRLTPGTFYTVTIIAISYGDIFSDSWFGTAKSEPYTDWIETEKGICLNDVRLILFTRRHTRIYQFFISIYQKYRSLQQLFLARKKLFLNQCFYLKKSYVMIKKKY